MIEVTSPTSLVVSWNGNVDRKFNFTFFNKNTVQITKLLISDIHQPIAQGLDSGH